MAGKVLVIGATSKIGAEVVSSLVSRGETVRAATRRPADYRSKPGVEKTYFSYDERDSMEPALRGADRVFMISKWTDLHPEQKLNRLVEYARANGVSRIVLVTPKSVDPDAGVRLGMVEKRIEGSGIAYTFMHPNWFMQNFSHGTLLPGIRDVGRIAAPAGDGAVSFVDARDLAEVAVAALCDGAHANQTYDLTGGETISYGQAADILSGVLGRSILYQSPTEEQVRSLLSYHEWQADDIDHILGLFEHVRMNRAAAVSPTLAALLGREPTRFEQFARDHAAVWR